MTHDTCRYHLNTHYLHTEASLGEGAMNSQTVARKPIGLVMKTNQSHTLHKLVISSLCGVMVFQSFPEKCACNRVCSLGALTKSSQGMAKEVQDVRK